MGLPQDHSYLLIPGHHKAEIEIALSGSSSADVVIIDLEDSVPPHCRDEAIANLRRDPAASAPRVVCRIRAGLQNRLEDIAVLPAWVDGVLLAQASTPADVEVVSEALCAAGVERSISLLLESAYAIENLPALLCGPPIEAIMLGPHDLRTDTGMASTPDESELLHPRARMVFAARAAGVRRIVDGPYGGNDEGLHAALRRAGALGMTGKIILDEQQASVVNEHFAQG